MDYQAEQDMELEALQAILMDDLQDYVGTLPDGWTQHGQPYKIVLSPLEDGEEEDDDTPLLDFVFAHTPSYPDEPPCVRVKSARGLGDAEVAEAQALVEAEASASLGMAMIFNLVTAAKDWLRTKSERVEEIDPVEARKRAEAEDEAKRAAQRAHGTMVTSETFAAWKARFEAEMAEAAAKAAEASKGDERASRLTGKAFFMRQYAAGVEGTEEGAAGSDSEGLEATEYGEDGDFDDDDEDDDFDPDAEGFDSEDEDLLDEYLAAKGDD